MLIWRDGAPSLDEAGRLAWATVDAEPPLFLGLDGEAPRFSHLPDGDAQVDSRAHLALLGQLDETDAPLFAAALSLANWHRRHGYCSVCGAATLPNRGGWSRACGSCAAEHYPRADPVVIMLATYGDRLLLGRQPHYAPGRFSAPISNCPPRTSASPAIKARFSNTFTGSLSSLIQLHLRSFDAAKRLALRYRSYTFFAVDREVR